MECAVAPEGEADLVSKEAPSSEELPQSGTLLIFEEILIISKEN